MKTIRIIIPCYNEEESIPTLFQKLQILEEKISDRFSILFCFINDGSSDNTKELIEKNLKKLKNAELISHEYNKNLGEALKTGINSLKEEYIGFLDSDFTYDPLIIIALLEGCEKGYDLVTVSPYHKNGTVENVPAWRLLLSKGITIIYQLLMRKKIYTFTAMVRVIRADKVKQIIGERSDFAFVAEMMIKAIKNNYKILEVPTTLKSRIFGVSKMRTMNTIFAHIQIVLKILFRRKF